MRNMPPESLSRAELEKRLKEKSESISGRFESFESKMPGKMPSVASFIKEHKSSKIVLSVGAGLLVGLIIFGRRSSSKQIDYDDGVSRLSSQLASRIADLLQHGSSSDDAVKRAFEEQPPIMRLSKESEGMLSSALKQVMQAGVSMVGSELASYLRNRKKDESSS